MRKGNVKIAVIAPAFREIGGPEVATHNLVDGLLQLDQDVTLFAPGDWTTRAKQSTRYRRVCGVWMIF